MIDFWAEEPTREGGMWCGAVKMVQELRGVLPVSSRVTNGTKEVTVQCVTEDDVSRQILEQ